MALDLEQGKIDVSSGRDNPHVVIILLDQFSVLLRKLSNGNLTFSGNHVIVCDHIPVLVNQKTRT